VLKGLVFSTPIPLKTLTEKGDRHVMTLSKKSKSVRNWHSKAMLIDPHKTRITIITLETLEWKERLHLNES
jgi:hypothetical protein